MKKVLLILLSVLSINAFAQAFESFNFTGSANANGWTTHSGTAGQLQADALGSLTYTGLASSTGNKINLVAGNSEDINKPITGVSGIGYYSVLLNVPSTTGLYANSSSSNEHAIGFGGSAGSTAISALAGRIYTKAGVTPNTFVVGILNQSGTGNNVTYLTTEYPCGVTLFIVVKVDVNVSPINASLFVNPIPGQGEPAPNISNNSGANAFTNFASIYIRQAGNASGGTGNIQLDEIRVGSTWASVTPGLVSPCATYNTISAMACNSYTLNNQTYTASGSYVQTLPNANSAGCDSVINLNLMIHNSSTSTLNISNCGPYTLNNQTYTSSGTYTQNLQNIHGCDSTITLNLSIVNSLTYYQDADNDGYGNATISQIGCNPIAGYVTNNNDCDDSNNAIFPGAVDVPGNGIDEDCNGVDAPLQLGIYQFAGTTDCNVQDVLATNSNVNINFSDFSSLGTTCASGAGYFNRSGWNQTSVIDLNQYNEFTISGINCTNLILSKLALNHRTSGTGGNPIIHLRSSLDNFASDIDTLGSSSNGNQYYNDTVILPSSFHNVGTVTFRFFITNQANATSTLRMDNISIWGSQVVVSAQQYFADVDGDGFGDAMNDTLLCNPPSGYVINNLDCDDTDALVNPNTIWYQDLDNDQIGNTAVSITACAQPVGYVLTDGDCNDNDAAITAPMMYYSDNDQDGFGDDATGTLFCQAPVNLIPIGGDCDDNNNAINPNATEICDGLDNNCNGQEDEGLTFLNYYFDGDSDGYGIGNPTVSCTPITGYATLTGDCDDSDNTVNPGAADAEGNGIDENCDGVDGVLGIIVSSIESSVSPNPSTGKFQVQLSAAISVEVIVLDLNGKVQARVSSNTQTINLDLTQLKPGTYFVNVVGESYQTTHRIVKQ